MTTRLRSIFTLWALLLAADLPAKSQDDTTGSPPPAHPVIHSLPGDFSLVKKFAYPTPPDAPHLTADQQAAYDFLHPQTTKIIEVDAVSKGGLRRDVEHFATGK